MIDDSSREDANEVYRARVDSAIDDPACCSDKYHPGEHDSDAETSDTSDTPQIVQAPQRRIHRATRAASHSEKRRLLDDQVTFIILTRNNNKPDPYGSRSSTHGPLPWPAVAKLYNEAFCVDVGGAAMEKRARQRREAWVAARPAYPRKIVYAEKVKVIKEKAKPKEKKVKPVVEVTCQPAFPASRPIRDEEVVDFAAKPVKLMHDDMNEMVTIEIVDANEQLCGRARIPAHDVRKSSALVAHEIEQKSNLHITLSCPSKAVVDRYVQCISPTRLMSLPNWDMSALSELYLVATQLEDEYVRDLVLERWRDTFQQGAEFELDTDDLNYVFQGTEAGDPARQFWAGLVYSGGGTQQIIDSGECHGALVVMLEEMIASVKGHS
ncbi:hypothetical protein EK21DRAFT_57206 [Setomelanomma holmii]|uniref:Uncharacterized protein n=1 Tax=Setomelanomma holmii TaxID=210430 RepID=A0A9P4HGW4_9PLEO|nr:hypothetical protein EK21DRAFT_57206 [Setomelanomma holmii]